jgi:acetolactate synthase-1/2/3 large subunit
LARERTAARILVDQLRLNGVSDVFCVPGESFLAVLDSLRDTPIRVTVCRQEGGAAMMAEAVGKLTGRPGICFVTRGPGSTNASPGLHIARQDSSPMILFVGQVARRDREREAFQEIDYRAVFGSIAKWVTEIDDPRRVPEMVSRAFHVATSGRPGPVVIALPEDMLSEAAAVGDARPFEPTETYPGKEALAQLAEMLAAAERPIAIVGGSRWSEQAVADFAAFAESWDLPVACSFRRQMLFPARHRCYAGDLGLGANPKLVARIRDADLVLLAGGRLSEIPSQGYTLLDIPEPLQALVHVHADIGELNRVYHARLAIHASPMAFAEAAAGLLPPAPPAWAGAADEAHSDYVAWSDPKSVDNPGRLRMNHLMSVLRDAVPEDAIIVNGAGNFASWLHRFWPTRGFGTQLAPTSGSMGYSVPPTIAAKRLHPDRMVLGLAGDGCFLMNGQEFATAVQYDLPVIIIVVDNGMFGTIRMHQERHYPGRVASTDLRNPDFAAYATAFGGYGERVETDAAFAPAFERAVKSGKPSILHLIVDPEAITPSETISSIRSSAEARGSRGGKGS